MILVRDIFQCKFGTAGALVQRFKESGEQGRPAGGGRMRILTDLSGPYDTLVIETVAESMDAYHRQLQEQFADPALREQSAGMGESIESGRREFYTIEMEG